MLHHTSAGFKVCLLVSCSMMDEPTNDLDLQTIEVSHSVSRSNRMCHIVVWLLMACFLLSLLDSLQYDFTFGLFDRPTRLECPHPG
jgi:hypothetical protein